MNIGIIFGTKRAAATGEIVQWMTNYLQAKGHDVVVGGPGDFSTFTCDHYLLGTAVYAFSAKRTGLPRFIRTHRKELQGTGTGVFIVCGVGEQVVSSGDSFLKRFLKNTFLDRQKYLTSIVRLLPEPPVSTTFFQGYQEPEDRAKTDFPSQQERVVQWCLGQGL